MATSKQSRYAPPKMKRAVIYTRKSVFKGLDQQYNSLEAQEDLARSFIHSHSAEGWQYLRSYTDAGLSGGNINRPALQEMLNAARNHEFEMVVVFKLDRLARNQRDFLNLLDVLEQNGVEVASVSEPFDTSTYMGRAMRNLLGVFAEMEREMISERTKSKLEASKQQGYHIGGIVPFGYDRKDNILYPNEDAKHVLWMFQQYANGETITYIARTLNVKKVYRLNIRREKKARWLSENVVRVLRNAAYAGYIRSADSDELYEGKHQAIVDRELWHMVNAKLDETAEQTRINHSFAESSVIFPLKGLLRCGCCGKKLRNQYTLKRGNIYRYYVCSTRLEYGKNANHGGCACPQLNAGEIENFVVSQVENLGKNPALLAAVIATVTDQNNRFGTLDVQTGHIGDCLYDLKKLFEYAEPVELQKIFTSIFDEIRYDWQGNKLDFRYRVPELQPITK